MTGGCEVTVMCQFLNILSEVYHILICLNLNHFSYKSYLMFVTNAYRCFIACCVKYL